jgi:hypothetical protein
MITLHASTSANRALAQRNRRTDFSDKRALATTTGI